MIALIAHARVKRRRSRFWPIVTRHHPGCRAKRSHTSSTRFYGIYGFVGWFCSSPSGAGCVPGDAFMCSTSFVVVFVRWYLPFHVIDVVVICPLTHRHAHIKYYLKEAVNVLAWDDSKGSCRRTPFEGRSYRDYQSSRIVHESLA